MQDTKLIIDEKEYMVNSELTVIQALEDIGIEIPRFCFHEKLSIAGNCRMCLIEVVGAPKSAASCHLGVRDLRPGPNGEPPKINTKSEVAKKAQKGAMEFLLANHPLDCPICDQGGECDLQDQAMKFGTDKSRFSENKRAVENKDIGPLVKTVMTRCIHCTRCVRFSTEVAGVSELGATGRGEDMEITTYLEKAMDSELQGNVIDLCPVGALTSKPYEFKARSWELIKTESIDVMDALGSNIRIDSKGSEVMRIIPRFNDDINEEWISDKARFIWDGLKVQRLDRPYVRTNNKLKEVSWSHAIDKVIEKMNQTIPERIGCIAGDMSTAEEMYSMKKLMDKIGSGNYDCRQDSSKLSIDYGRASYIFNPTVNGIEEADGIVIIGSNPRIESPVLNARIRKRWLTGNLKVSLIGEESDLTYPYNYIGNNPNLINDAKKIGLDGCKKIIWLVGGSVVSRDDGLPILSKVVEHALNSGSISDDWNGLSILHTAASRVAGLDIGFVPNNDSLSANNMKNGLETDLLFLLGADEIEIEKGPCVVYIGSHGDIGANRADIILPGSCYTEKNGSYVNTEGRLQEINRAVFPPGNAKDDWTILKLISDKIKQPLDFIDTDSLRKMMFKDCPNLLSFEQHNDHYLEDLRKLSSIKGSILDLKMDINIKDFNMTNPIARSSKVMANCSIQKSKKQ